MKELTWPRTMRAAAAAGIAGPILFTAGWLVLGVVRRGEYDPIADQISALTAGPWAWAGRLNFVTFGLLLIAFAVGLRRGVRAARRGSQVPAMLARVGPAALGVNGLNLLIAGVFPLHDPFGVHGRNSTVFFATIGIVLVLVSLRLRDDQRWRDLARYTLATGAVLFALLFVLLPTTGRGGLLNPWVGLVQRLVLVLWMPCLIVLAVRLRRIAADAERAALGLPDVHRRRTATQTTR